MSASRSLMSRCIERCWAGVVARSRDHEDTKVRDELTYLAAPRNCLTAPTSADLAVPVPTNGARDTWKIRHPPPSSTLF